MRVPIARDGLLYAGVIFTLAVLAAGACWWIISLLFVLAGISVLLFFRFPDRTVIADTGTIYAPADGRIIQIREEYEGEYCRDVRKKVSIFMSIFNVHINYAPLEGVVECIKYTPGKFHPAFSAASETGNENNFIGINGQGIKVGVRQIAGWIARRIVCNCQKGDKVSAGGRIGLIKFGSRVDIFVPVDYRLWVDKGQRVVAGRTIIGKKQ